MRQRNNNFMWGIRCLPPNQTIELIIKAKNLQTIADEINLRFFSSFKVISRSMVNNWVYGKDKIGMRRGFANKFKITKIPTKPYPISA